MIDRITGKLIYKAPLSCVIDVGGVGYILNISVFTSSSLPKIDSIVTLLTKLMIRQDKIDFFGFMNEKERQMFDDLISISGIGPRTALSMLSGFSPDEIMENVSNGNIEQLSKIKGIGKRTAERLYVELKNKLNIKQTIFTPIRDNKFNDACKALVQLGFRRNDIEIKISNILKLESDLSIEEIIRKVLKER